MYSDYDSDEMYLAQSGVGSLTDQFDNNQYSSDDSIDRVYFEGNESYVSSEQSEKQLEDDYNIGSKQFLIDKIYEFDWIDSESCKYPNNIKDFIKEQMVCQICLRLMKQVVELNCKHIICSCCLIKITQNSHSYCPFCKQKIGQQKKETSRSKFLSHFINQLQLKCFQCEHEQNIQDQTNNHNKIWEGKLFDLIQHLKFHDDSDNIFYMNQQDQWQICQNHFFGCTARLKNSYQQFYHLGGNCQYSWNQCTQCMKIVFKQSADHNCDDSDFNTLIKIQPDYKQIQLMIKYKYIRQKDQKELNFRIVIASNKFNQQFHNIMVNLKQYFLYDITTFTEDICELQFINQFMLKNFMEMMQTDIFQIEQQLSQVQLLYGEEYINFKNSQKQIPINYIEQKSTVIHLGQNSYQKQKKVFVARINGIDKYYAEFKIKSSMEIIFGEISAINLFGRGRTGKFYGEIEFASVESAQLLLNTTALFNGDFRDVSGFVCSVSEYRERHN